MLALTLAFMATGDLSKSESPISTVCVTGVTGYLGSVLASRLIDKGYKVIGTTRNPARQRGFIPYGSNLEAPNLELVKADLLDEDSFAQHFLRCQAVMHTASPFKLKVTDPKKELIQPAVQGTRNVMRAAIKSSSVLKVVVTSSAAAVTDSPVPPEKRTHEYTADDWQMDASLSHKPYRLSKRLAELEAWRFHLQDPMASTEELTQRGSYFGELHNAAHVQVSVINPAFILGPPVLTRPSGESILFMKRMIEGAYKEGAPDFAFGVVDVRDVADAHIAAMERHEAVERAVSPLELSELLLQGMEKRALDGSHNTRYLAKHLRKALPKKVATAPGDSSASQYRTLYNMGNCEHILGVGLRELQETVTDMATFMTQYDVAVVEHPKTGL